MPHNSIARSVAAIMLALGNCGLGPHPAEPVPPDAAFTLPPLGRMEPVAGAFPAPYESVCRSAVHRRTFLVVGKNYTSGGALLRDDLLLTAAHNYASTKAPFSLVRDRSVECGAGVLSTPPWWRLEGGFDRATQVRHPSDFKAFNWSTDYALVALGERAPRRSSFRLPRIGEEDLVAKDSIVVIAGYPAELPNTGSIMYHGRARVTAATTTEIQYALDTERGLSGGPLWVERNGEFILIGIHVGENPQGTGRAHRLNFQSLSNVAAWIAEFDQNSITR